MVQDKGINSDELSKAFRLYNDCKRLYAAKNFIEGLPFNTPKFSLHTVDLSNNSLSTLDGFEILVNLAHLNVSDNSISSTWGLNSNTKLVELHMANNSVRLIEGLERLKRLKVVDFSHNRIKTYSDVRSLSLNRSLTSISFRGNVLATYSNFKFKVLHFFPGVTVTGDEVKGTVNDVHQRHLDMVDDGGRNSAIGRVVVSATEGEDGGIGRAGTVGQSAKKRGQGVGIASEMRPTYHSMATIAMQNIPDERTRGGLTGSVTGPSASKLNGVGAYSQFGHGSGSRVTSLHVTSSARRMAARQKHVGQTGERAKFATKPLPWRQPPAPQPHVTKRVSEVLDDSKDLAGPAGMYSSIEEEVWWTPSRHKEGGPHFQPMPNQPDTLRGGKRGREKRGREGMGMGSGLGSTGVRREFKGTSSFASKVTGGKGRSTGGKISTTRGLGGKSSTDKSENGSGPGNSSSTPGKQERKFKITLGMSQGHHLVGTPSHHQHGNDKPVMYAKPVSKSLVSMQSTPRGKYKMNGGLTPGKEISMAPDTGGRSLFGKSVYQYADSVYGRGREGGGRAGSPEKWAQAKERETVSPNKQGRALSDEDWMKGVWASGGGAKPAIQKQSLMGGTGKEVINGFGMSSNVMGMSSNDMGMSSNGTGMSNNGVSSSNTGNPTVMEVRMKQIGGGGITLDDRLVEVLKVMVKNKKQGIQDIAAGGMD